MTLKGKTFMDEFSGRQRRSHMVSAYWRRRKKQTRLKIRLGKRKWMERKIAKGTWIGSGGDAAITAGGPAEDGGDAAMDQSYVGVETAQGNVEVVEEFE